MDFTNSINSVYSDRIKNDFENLKNEIIENPSILDNFSPDDMLEFYNKSNVFNRKCLDGDLHNKKFTLLSYINGREDFFKKITTTTMISYLFRQCLDYCINITDLKTKINDDDYLEVVYNKYRENPEHERKIISAKVKHEYIKNTYDIDYDLNDDEQLKEYFAFEFSEEDLENIELLTDDELKELQKVEYEVNKNKKMEHIKKLMKEQSKNEQEVIYRFLKNTFSFNPDRHIKQSYKYEEIVDTYEQYKEKVLNKVEKNIKDELKISSSIIENIVPSDNLWYKFNNYYEMHYDLFKTFTNLLYKVESDRDLLINIHGQFDSKEEVDRFVKLNEANFITSPVLIANNEWNMFAKYLPNRENGEVIGQESEIVNGLLQKYKEDSKIAEELTRSNIKRSKLENMYKHGKSNDNIKEYLANNPRESYVGNMNENQVTEEEYEEFENKIQKLSNITSDDDFAIQYKIIKANPDTETMDETKIYQ